MVPGAENKKENYEIYISLELVSSRVKPDSKKDLDPQTLLNLNIADNGGQGAIIIGDKIKNFNQIDLNSIKVEVDVNGKITGAW